VVDKEKELPTASCQPPAASFFRYFGDMQVFYFYHAPPNNLTEKKTKPENSL